MARPPPTPRFPRSAPRSQEAGLAQWRQNPQDGNPGDALRAYDGLADGYGIHAYLGDGRMASTAGHDSPYGARG